MGRVSIYAAVIAPDHPHFWKKRKKEPVWSPDDPRVNLLILQECSAITKSSATDPKAVVKTWPLGGKKDNLDSNKLQIWDTFKTVMYKTSHYLLSGISKCIRGPTLHETERKKWFQVQTFPSARQPVRKVKHLYSFMLPARASAWSQV